MTRTGDYWVCTGCREEVKIGEIHDCPPPPPPPRKRGRPKGSKNKPKSKES